MSIRYIILPAFLLLCNCSSVPVKRQNVIPAKEYKNYISLKDEPTRKTIPERIVSIFKKKSPEVQSSSPKPTAKKINRPKRRLRQTNTNNVSLEEGALMPMSPRDPEIAPKSKSNIIVYFIYIQAIIIAILVIYLYYKLLTSRKKASSPPRKLNL